jgi:hypothetical protein
MRTPKYAGLVLGLTLSIVVAGVALAGRSTGHPINAGPGWNTPIFNNISFTTFGINNCQSSASSLKYDWMHHWPIIPSTGTAERSLACIHNNIVRSTTWSANGTADYSVEYTHNNSATFTNYWSADY